ncbi:DUF5069 domain-containing protein [Actomonas aquatica]|uniref:DUF5069 domain-containing protein n=1 Tax=Actomonas aquatica TaxID=2866162 RepID=A0ABZ1CC56_9BACT|nr:DUF5069 domain-containing protein [Opitutus sp. WL0086]WRQ88164.1 DUF5069 domain-containing protein [Opitutus sp. WL0086]
MIDYSAPDLTQHPPRSPRVRLGGFVHLPRLLDKARAFAAGKHGDYIYPCPMDERLFAFAGVDATAFLDAVKCGKSDTEMLAWLMEHLSPARLPHEILAWSDWLENLAPGDPRRHGNFATEIERMAPGRLDIVTTFDRLELDDYTAFGGRG